MHILCRYAISPLPFVCFVSFTDIFSGRNAVSSQVFHNVDVAALSCRCSTLSRAMDSMRSQILNHLQMPVGSCPISASRSAVHVVRSQVSHNSQTTI